MSAKRIFGDILPCSVGVFAVGSSAGVGGKSAAKKEPVGVGFLSLKYCCS
jgi:hypothetical protein